MIRVDRLKMVFLVIVKVGFVVVVLNKLLVVHCVVGCAGE